MFKKKINDFFSIENRFFKKYHMKRLEEKRNIEEYRSELI